MVKLIMKVMIVLVSFRFYLCDKLIEKDCWNSFSFFSFLHIT
ncbi:hypothetical protein YN1HA_18620 [Sulfurisphaera ohwakuensis]